ncbi:Lrp/AsnC ligand binding domain-containing protein [Paraburkholderia sediminicola]|uniref:Lrp/AsnC ligand binding domain-containing protein n=1 Tax=Paraburkholderia sediminicola TaxID=458836 RepID=UPI0038BB2AEF
MSCFQMTGDADYNLRVVVRDLDAYHLFLTRMLTRIPGVEHIKSNFTLKTMLMRSAPPLLPVPSHVRQALEAKLKKRAAISNTTALSQDCCWTTALQREVVSNQARL